MLPRLTALTIALLSLTSPADAARDMLGPRPLAMGGTLRATAAGLAGPVLNPAGMSLARMYVLGTTYQYRASDQASQLQATIVDSITSKLAAGIYYSFIHASPEQAIRLPGKAFTLEETLDTHEVGLSLSVPLGQMIFIGMTTKYVNHGGSLPDDAPADLASPDISAVTLDAGGVIRIGSGLHLGVVGYNLVEVGDPGFPRALGLGAGYHSGQFTLEFNSVLDFNSDPNNVKASYHGGGEIFVGGKYALRAGASHDTLRSATYVSWGGGLVSSKVGLSFGMRQMVDGGAETLVSFALEFFLQ